MNDHTLFVYGSLRPGGHLYGLWRGTVTSARPTTAPGMELLLVPHGQYPAMIRQRGAQVHGTLLTVKDGPAWRDVYDMECRSGYEWEGIWVSTADGPQLAGAFLWEDEHAGEYLDPVPGADWIRHSTGVTCS